MIVTRTEIIQFDGNDGVSSMCHYSKNLFNQANYEIKQALSEEGKWLRYEKLNGLFKGTENYGKMPAQSAQQTLKLIDKSWKSFFKSIKDWKKNSSNYFAMPKTPKYEKKNGEYILVFTNQQCKIKDGYVVFPKIMNLEIETRLHDIKLRQVRIVPMGVGYNEKWIQKCNMGKRNNQKFTQLPFYKLVNQLKYKAEDANIKIIEQEESYTSKCSFLDNEPALFS